MNDAASVRDFAVNEKRRRILHCVDQVLENLGSDVRRALTYYMRRESNLKHYEIPDKPHDFALALRRVFGSSSGGIESQIVELIVREFHLRTDSAQSFEKAVGLALSEGS